MEKLFEHYFLIGLIKFLQLNGSTYPNESYMQFKTPLCNSFETWGQILNFSNQVSARSESQYLLYNQRHSTFILL